MFQERRRFLHGTVAAAMTAAGNSLLPDIFLEKETPRSGRSPNIIFILMDDLGWHELGCYGNTFNETPHLDRLAGQGVRFLRAYAAAPVCSPTRAALLTGQWPARLGITDYLRPDSQTLLSPQHPTLAQMLKKAGYRTGIIGKWHLCGYAGQGGREAYPDTHGFDETLISEIRGIGGGSYFHPYHFNPGIPRRLEEKEFLVDRMNRESVEFIERHRAQPFFLFLSHYAVHTALLGKPELVAKYESKPESGKGPKSARNNPHLAAQLESVDQGVGMIVDKLRELSLAENTLIIFTSDNGGEGNVTSNEPLRGAKSMLYEGGIRESMIVWWPGVVPAAATCAAPVSTVDFYPTLIEMAGIAPKSSHPPDGVSLLPFFRDPKHSPQPSRPLYWHYPLDKPHFLGGDSAGAMLGPDDFKIIEHYDDGRMELYNLKEDPGEKKDLARALPQKAASMKRQFHHWLDSLGTVAPQLPKGKNP